MNTFIRAPRPNCGARGEGRRIRVLHGRTEEINLYYMADREEAVLQQGGIRSCQGKSITRRMRW